MEKIKVTLKDDHKVEQPTTLPWDFGYIVGFVTMADNRGYAVVQTEHNNFETVCIYSLRAI